MAELTGRHVLIITVSAFSVIIGVNLTLAYQAVSTFPGLEVKNSYVASQDFNKEKQAQLGLGWTLAPDYTNGELRLAFTDNAGQPVLLGSLDVLLGRPTEALQDSRPAFVRRAGVYVAQAALQPGKWMMKVEARAQNGTRFYQRIDLFVKG